MEFALHFANLVCPGAAEAHRLAIAAETAGFEALLTVEHVVWPTTYASAYPYSPSGRLPGGPETDLPDPIVWMANVAAVTSTLRLMTGVLVLPQRNPLIVAKQMATLDALSLGRIELGIGVGWLAEEFEALNVPFSGRGARTDEYIGVLRALWSDDNVSHHGQFVNFTAMSCNPKPHNGAVPIIIGGHSERAAARAGALGDGFFPATGSPAELAPLFDVVRRTAETHGRDPRSISFMTGWPAGIDQTDPRRVADELGRSGVRRVVISTQLFLPDLEDGLGRFGENVIAELS